MDSEEALKIGKLSGASLQVLGSMEKIGSKYNINARMVQTETGDIVATAFKTVPASLFDEEAKYYLTDAPVPKTQAIGIYAGYIYRAGSESRLTSGGIDSNSGATIEGRDMSQKPLSYALGARYDLSSKIQLDYIYYVANYNLGVRACNSVGCGSWVDATIGLQGSRFLASYKYSLNNKLHSYSGVGVSKYTLQSVDGVNTVPLTYTRFSITSVHLAKKSLTVPLIYERFEYRPQSRIALGLSITYEFKKQSFYVMGKKIGDLKQFYIEPTVGVYF
ncbi:MAG: hypothetical protein Q7R35_13765 [Elusimicrobiota bacterium]|nr:hypothetical protein [Elusimicrobiota bacterium]